MNSYGTSAGSSLINLTGAGAFEVTGGFVFAYGTGLSNVISGSHTITAPGVVVAWNQAQGTTAYIEGTDDDLSISTGATATWHKDATLGGGISYQNGANTGFFPVSSVLVASGQGDFIDFDVPDFFTTDATYINWSYVASTRTITVKDDVTVVGTVTGATQRLVFNIASGKTATWRADYEGNTGNNNMLALTGAGTFEMATGGSIANHSAASSSATISVTDVTTILKVSGGTIGTTVGYAINSAGNVTISGGTVEATGNNGYAISATGGNVTVNGGTVSATTGYAIIAIGTGTITVNDGFVFAYGTNIIGNVIRTSSGSPTITDGVVVAWDQAQNVTTYAAGSTTDLTPSTGTTAVWGNSGGQGGIVYENGTNKGFFAVSGVTVTGPPSIGTTTLPGGTVGTAYSATLSASGTTPITWSVTTGSLPDGLDLDGSTGEISGTPTTAGTVNFTVTAANGALPNATQDLSITVKEDQLAPTGLGQTNETAAGANDGTITNVTTAMEYKLSGASDYIAVTGTPLTGLAPGTYLVRYAATANYHASPDTQIVIAAFGALAFADSAAYDIPASTVGAAITSIDVSGGASGGTTPHTFSAVGLPAGITISAAGLISGTPTTAGAAGTATITVTDSASTAATAQITIAYGAIAKGTQNAPTGLGKTGETAAGANNGTITGVTTDMEYKLSTASGYTTVTVIPLTGLAPGTYYVRYAATADYNAGTDTQIVIAAYGAALAFTDSAAYDIPASVVGTAITSIDVSGGASGGTSPYTFSATGLPGGISINAAGIISGAPTTAGAAGTATITVTDNASATQNITIAYGTISAAGSVLVTNVTVSGAATITTNGGTTQLTATVTPSNATMQTVTWSVASGSAATVSSSGLVTATANGSVTIRATAQDGSGKYGEITITVSGQGGGGTPTPTTYALTVVSGSGSGSYAAGTQVIITANAAPSGQVFDKWTVTGGGSLANASSATTTYTMPGNAATVTATYKTAPAGTTLVTNITVSGGTSITAKGGTLQLTANITPANATNKAVTWTVVSGSGATVDANGKVTATANGTVVIRATAQDGSAVSCDISITITGQDSGGTPPTTYALTVTNGSGSGSYAAGTQIVITANSAPSGQIFDKWVLTSGGGSLVNASSATTTYTMPTGAVTVTATYKTAPAGTTLVTSITVSGGTSITAKGGTLQLTANVTPANATNKAVTWTVVSGSGATVDANGKVTAIANGTVVIRATAQDGSAVSCDISITITGQDSGGNGNPTPTPTPVKHPVLEQFPNYTGSGDVSAIIDGDYTMFVRLWYNNAIVNTQNYIVTQGSTIITLKESYLKTLGAGTHIFNAEFSDGYSENIRLIVNAASNGNNTNPSTGGDTSVPKTGDDSNMLGWWIALLASVLGVLCVLVWRKWRQLRGTW